MTSNKALLNAFYEAALFLKDQCEHGGWRKFSSNYLREHARCRYGVAFSNTLSPKLLRQVLKEHPDLAQWIKTNPLKIDIDLGRDLEDYLGQGPWLL